MVQAGQVSGGIHFHQRDPDRAGAPTPRQLPSDVRHFVNRTADLDRLNAILPGTDGEPLVLTVCVIAGTAGAGKTSLALRWAHQVRDRFPDGQLYVNLRGYDPAEPVSPDKALRGFLTALGVPPEAVPADLADAAAQYRSLLAERRMLVVLDNAATVTQVRPLLPAGPGALAVVTSRGRLSGLTVREGAQRLTLGTLPEPEAVALLRAVTAGYRPEDDTGKLTELARLCAGLPLALRVAGERAAAHPHLRLDDLIAELRDESALWDALSTGEGEDSEAVRTVFAWSYRALPGPAARLFRLLGLHPGPEFSLPAAAALAALPPGRTRQLLDVLVGAHLLEQNAPDRYEFHDLLRAYASDEAQGAEPPEGRLAAVRRVLDWYLHTADAAQGWIEPDEDRLPLDPPAEGVTPLDFAGYDQAVDWAEREQGVVLPAVRAAERAGLDRHAALLAAVFGNAQAPSAPVADWLEPARAGLAAVRRLDGPAAETGPLEAGLLEGLGMALSRINRPAESLEHHRAALALRERLGDRHGIAQSLNLLGLGSLRTRQLEEAAGYFERAGAAFREQGPAPGEAVALANLASVRLAEGRTAEAADLAGRALDAHRARGSRAATGNALRLLAAVRLDGGEPAGALAAAQEAVDLALELRDHTLEGYWLLTLGDAQRALGHTGDALASFQRSAALHRRLGDRGREALAWYGTGETCRAAGRDGEAAAFLRQAAAAQRELGDGWQEAVALAALADAEPGRADEHRARARELLEGYQDARARALRARLGEGSGG